MEGSVLFRYHKSYIIHKKLERDLTALPYLHFRLILINYSQDAVISFKEVSEWRKQFKSNKMSTHSHIVPKNEE